MYFIAKNLLYPTVFFSSLYWSSRENKLEAKLSEHTSDSWLVGWSVSWLVGRLVCSFVGWLIGWLVGWLVGWPAGRSVGWLVGWLVGWFKICRLLLGYLMPKLVIFFTNNYIVSSETPSLTVLCQRPSWKDSKKYVVHMISGQYLGVARLFENIYSESTPQQISTWPRIFWYSISCSCGKVYNGETCRPLKVRLKEHRKVVIREEFNVWPYMERRGKSSDHWDEVKIIDRDENWRIGRLKEAVHMLGHSDLLSRPSIEMNTTWKPIIKKGW